MLLDKMFVLSIARGKVVCYNQVVSSHTFNDFRRREMMKKTLLDGLNYQQIMIKKNLAE